jgi:hypothetical protein
MRRGVAQRYSDRHEVIRRDARASREARARNRERERRIRCLLATVLCLEVNRGLPRLPHALAVQIARTAFAPLRAPAGATVDLTAE